ncbi:hypothetical protein, partial [Pantoea sp. Mhis]|uniref:hypothetical protein n=1 Tax=Pantoea sp. Mhis TaxID=2576759 RepID=UPI00135A786C
ASYKQQIILKTMIKHRYDLQYQLYTLALHRYLIHRLNDYQYEKDFGGVFYLFLRGMNGISCDNGVFYTRPKYNLIVQLDNLFMNK